ncbi:hypothetical protein PST407_02133 [Pseudomonas syringae pv. tomato]|uniref:Uncharacterized protein n=1 Tax=Pseudomonas syringae pv. tomato TaxID=323 RepID=A0AAV1BDN6_PSEUB|nr:hypothetical protein PSTA9_03626 [Pseudomonas syringae pv. tomato]KUR49302.1 hypothetical protein PST407_02133 [Pseudomonas syringae pv. tomato]CAI8741178.1 hypothetical protein DAPPPG215_02305 [Pseudomonas syringae pv. tomato]
MATLVKNPSGTWKALIRKNGWPTCSGQLIPDTTLSFFSA